MMAFVQKSTSTGSFGGTNSATPGAMSAGATAGNLLVLGWGHQQFDSNTVAMAATGYSSAGSINAPTPLSACGILYKVAAGGETNATANSTTAGAAGSSFGDALLAEFSGLSATPYVSADSATNQNNGTTLTVSSSNPLSESSGLAVASFAGNASLAGGTWPPAGWTSLLADPAGGNTNLAYLIFSSNAQLTASIGTISSGCRMVATLSIFKTAQVLGGGANMDGNINGNLNGGFL